MTQTTVDNLPPENTDTLAEACRCYVSGYIDKAITLLKALFEEDAGNPDVRTLLFACYKDGGHIDKALDMARQFLATPANPDELALAWQAMLGVFDFEAAAQVQDKVLDAVCHGEITADLLPAMLLAANGLADIEPERMFALHQVWAGQLPDDPGHPAEGLGTRGRIRLAYVSGDFFRHPVSYFLLPVLSSHDRSLFETWCYSNTRHPADDLTDAIRQQCDHFIDITQMDDAALALRMRDDRIDIAVDLAGHTANGRTAAFAKRLAPVQLAWIGYPNTTGLSAMDYRIVDAHTDPQDDTGGYAEPCTETRLSMPASFLCYGIQWDVEPAKTPPCVRPDSEHAGRITFASFNNGRKINPGVIDAWGQILEQVPESRLLLKFAGCMQKTVQTNLHACFESRGIVASRIGFLPRTETAGEHIALYRKVDIALDTFPYTGTTTTFEALSQGVPVITLTGPAHRNRVSYSILKNIGYEETITDSVQAYVKRAVELAGNPNALGVLREVLPLLVRHAACNQPEDFTRKLETALLQACADKGLEMADTPQADSDAGERRLHIGGHQQHPGWEILDANASDLTDHVGNAADLSRFADASFEALYSSHVLEHFSYQGELAQVLAEWFRVIRPGGTMYASVPDLRILCRFFLQNEGISDEERYLLMRMMFGGQIDPYDFHKAGLYEELLIHLLQRAGFTRIRRVSDFGLFEDTSTMRFHDEPISLNLIAEKPHADEGMLWLCSFPKSGNTMLRIAVETYYGRPTVSAYDTRGDTSPLFGDKLDDPIGIKLHEVAQVPTGARLIYVHRDPRDVMISWFEWSQRMLPDENPSAFAEFLRSEAPRWRQEMEQVLAYPGPKLVLGYDELVHEAESAYSRLFSFIDPTTPLDVGRLAECLKNNSKEKSGAWFKEGGFGELIMPIEKRTSRWAEMLSDAELQQINAAIGDDMLNTLGYRQGH